MFTSLIFGITLQLAHCGVAFHLFADADYLLGSGKTIAPYLKGVNKRFQHGLVAEPANIDLPSLGKGAFYMLSPFREFYYLITAFRVGKLRAYAIFAQAKAKEVS
jgi:hypothetical protein